MRKWAGSEIRRLEETGSTNQEARKWAREGAPNGAVVIAKRQTSGRGRRGRGWESPEGGLWLSMIVRPEIKESLFPLLSYAVAVAARDATSEAAGMEVSLKWPNDVLLTGRKIAGILLEKEGSAAIIGIGINVAQKQTDFPPELQETAGSLGFISGKTIRIEDVEQLLLNALERRIDAWDFMHDYERHCVTFGAKVRVEAPGETFLGIAKGLDEAGALIVREEGGADRHVFAGDVKVRGMNGYV